MPQSHIIGTGSSTPERILSNANLETFVDTTDEWITRRTGIKERRISSKDRKESTTDLAAQAGLNAMNMAGIQADQLDMIVVGTVTGDRLFPSVACMVQEQIRARNATAFDVSAGCTGFLYGLDIVNSAIHTGSCHTALVIGAERVSSILDWEDRTTCVLLADGAGAAIVAESGKPGGILSSHMGSDGRLWDLLYGENGRMKPYVPDILSDVDTKPFRVIMEGNKLFKRAVEALTTIARTAMEKNSLTSDDISVMIPHQANIRIIRSMAKNLRIPMERVFTNVHKYGNTSAASVPIALDEANRKGILKRGEYVLLVSFGAGLTWAASILKWSL
jgi:3-oxoacyl-[acyl-carrier-protein] synthase-3